MALAARFHDPAEQVDRYFAHPCRDFARTDEALRLRRDGDDVAITWKGPRIDAATKTRRESEGARLAREAHDLLARQQKVSLSDCFDDGLLLDFFFEFFLFLFSLPFLAFSR